jgi:hypothetical protein
MFVRSAAVPRRVVTQPTADRREMAIAGAGLDVSGSSLSWLRKSVASVCCTLVMWDAPEEGQATSHQLLQSKELSKAMQSGWSNEVLRYRGRGWDNEEGQGEVRFWPNLPCPGGLFTPSQLS